MHREDTDKCVKREVLFAVACKMSYICLFLIFVLYMDIIVSFSESIQATVFNPRKYGIFWALPFTLL